MAEPEVCPVCQLPIDGPEDASRCPDCHAAHHRACWGRRGRCSAYACTPEVKRHGDIGRADIVIDAEAVREAVPLRPARTVRDRGPKTWSRLAIAAGIIALLGLPLFGIVLGPVAVALGAVALGMILARGRQRGAVIAALAVVLGLAEFAGWFWVLHGKGSVGTPIPMLGSAKPVPPRDLERVPEPIRSCLRASVAVQGSDGRLLGTRWGGSGVIIAGRGGELLILTNRHVVDPGSAGRPDGNRFEVMLADGQEREATVRWMDPQGVDLALLACPGPAPEGLRPIAPRGEPGTVMGERVFAVGNPEGLHWTYTEGVISAIRDMKLHGPEVEVIQTQTPINHGNSGGGLFDIEGRLVGLNTWTRDKMATEGLNFAISVRTVLARLAGAGFSWSEGDQPR